MNIRISAIATSVMLVTVMPRNSRQFFLNPSRQTRLGGARPYTENGTQYPGQLYSEVNTLFNHRRKWNFRSGYFVTPAATLTATNVGGSAPDGFSESIPARKSS